MFLMGSSNKLYFLFGTDINYSLQSVYQNGLSPKSDFGKIQDQSEFRIIGPN